MTEASGTSTTTVNVKGAHPLVFVDDSNEVKKTVSDLGEHTPVTSRRRGQTISCARGVLITLPKPKTSPSPQVIVSVGTPKQQEQQEEHRLHKSAEHEPEKHEKEKEKEK